VSVRQALVFGLLLCGAGLLGLKRPEGLADLVAIRHWSYPDYTRVVLELERPVRTRVRHLPADAAAGRPERLYLDLPGVWVGRRYARAIPVRDGLLQGIRLGQHTLRDSRLVIDLQRYAHHRLFALSAPDRIVVDVYGSRHNRATASGRPFPPLVVHPVHTVVVDPGHGGRDPGAIGISGLREEEVTLELARELRRRLEDRGFRVLMTRDGDETVSLEERTARAEGAGADVFVSLHANASRRRGAWGIETYILDASHERHALQVAARESGVRPDQLDALQRAMAELRVGELSHYSSELARQVQAEVVTGVRKVFGSARDLGVKPGPFHVLFLSGAPSILVEVGFLTNRQEARRLRSRFYRAVVAERIARALSRYRSHRALQLAGGAP